MRLTLWLKVWGVIFALGAADFLVLPGRTVAFLNTVGTHLGFTAARSLEQPGFWVPLAAAYMLLIAAFCFQTQVNYLLLAKVASSAAALGWFLLGGFEFPFLAAGLVDALIALGTLLLMRSPGPPPAA